MSYTKDVEKVPATSYDAHAVDAVVPGESFNYGTGIWAKMQRIAGRFGVEQRGIERVPEDERTDNKHPLLNVATMWLACNMVCFRPFEHGLGDHRTCDMVSDMLGNSHWALQSPMAEAILWF